MEDPYIYVWPKENEKSGVYDHIKFNPSNFAQKEKPRPDPSTGEFY